MLSLVILPKTCISIFAPNSPLTPPQVRLLDGSTITAAFKAQEPLAAVRVYIQMNSNTPEGQDFTLLSPYPRHIYTEQDMEKPLKELGELGRSTLKQKDPLWGSFPIGIQLSSSFLSGLVPSAVLVVSKKWVQEDLPCGLPHHLHQHHKHLNREDPEHNRHLWVSLSKPAVWPAEV